MRRYATYCKNFGENKLVKIASGPSDEDYNWTETLMRNPKNRWMMQGLSLHYYTLMDDWGHKGSATDFGEKEWFKTLKATLKMNEIISRHSTIMDKYDPEKRIGLYVDEWGDWFNVEPGTNPGFLYQQNTLRDAVVAAINLNIFNNHCDRVKMANIAQMVNVLQAMILTKGDQMVRTPSYYVYKMYKVHQNATLLPLHITCGNYSYGNEKVPSISASASMDSTGMIHISIVNLNPNKAVDVICEIRGLRISDVNGEILTSENINDFNHLGQEEKVLPRKFNEATLKEGVLHIMVPSKSVIMLQLKKRS